MITFCSILLVNTDYVYPPTLGRCFRHGTNILKEVEEILADNVRFAVNHDRLARFWFTPNIAEARVRELRRETLDHALYR
jgi:hypothetical protein